MYHKGWGHFKVFNRQQTMELECVSIYIAEF